MPETGEKRNLIRLPFTPRAYCQLQDGGREFAGVIRDISLLSLYMELEGADDLTGECDIQIVLEGEHSEMEINNMSGYIIRSDSKGLAIRFDEPFEWLAIVPALFKKFSRP
ncbi:MAG: hypothetical protein LJE64_05200 [Desulfofustis sp.]|jgi:hypothetical protein|nr:hypothetical protein [Desulfofustis sp.]